jgi:hypothetical protein
MQKMWTVYRLHTLAILQAGHLLTEGLEMLHTELLGCADCKSTYYVETVNKQVPLPSDDFIRHTFSKVAPGEEICLSKRDDDRNSIIIAISPLLADETVQQFFDRIGAMSGC